MRFRQKFSILVSLYGDDQNSPGISIVYAYIFRPGRAGPQWMNERVIKVQRT